jgi:hypothetical protein
LSAFLQRQALKKVMAEAGRPPQLFDGLINVGSISTSSEPLLSFERFF